MSPIPALAFAISLITPLLVAFGAAHGGWALWLPPVYAWVLMSALDGALGLNGDNPDPGTREDALFWHKLVTWIWVPVQFALIWGALWAATRLDHLSAAEAVFLMIGVGIATGGIGITYAHELIHRKSRFERGLGEALLASVLYGHFSTEHLYNHHIHVATPRDPATARRDEGFWRFLPRALMGSAASAWSIDAARARRGGRAAFGPANPWWPRFVLYAAFLGAAWALAGWFGVALYLTQAAIAILELEAVNYIEHYGLTRKPLGDGSYERAKPHHSWNAAHAATNLLLINLQRHSDHHHHPGRRFPLLQTYGEAEAPQLPFGYPLMVLMAWVPPLWFRVMNPRLAAWRRRHYPDIAGASADPAGAGR